MYCCLCLNSFLLIMCLCIQCLENLLIVLLLLSGRSWMHVFLYHCLKQWLLFLVYSRILCRPGLSDGTLNTTQQYDQSRSLRSPRTPLAPHWGSFVVVTAALFITSPFFYLYQRRDDHWWNSTHFWKFIHVTSFLLPFLISYLLEVEVTINGTYDSKSSMCCTI